MSCGKCSLERIRRLFQEKQAREKAEAEAKANQIEVPEIITISAAPKKRKKAEKNEEAAE